MIDKQALTALIETYLQGQAVHYELIELSITPSNEITVAVDSYEPMDVDFCAALNRYIQEHLDREVEDYSLEVGSVGLTDPFRTKMQYDKNLGNEVEVLTKDGRKLYGVLVDVTDEAFSVEAEVMVAVEGKKRKQKELQTLTFGYDAVKYTRYDLKV